MSNLRATESQAILDRVKSDLIKLRYSRSLPERKELAAKVFAARQMYVESGGKNWIEWLKSAGFSHGSAVNYFYAGLAIHEGFDSESFTTLSLVGRDLTSGLVKEEIKIETYQPSSAGEEQITDDGEINTVEKR